MANVKCVIVNPTAAELTNVNAGGDDVAAYSCSGVLTLSDAEIATLGAAGATTSLGVTVMYVNTSSGALPTNEVRRLAAKLLKLGRNPGSSIAEQ